jgi:hypothetical protein
MRNVIQPCFFCLAITMSSLTLGEMPDRILSLAHPGAKWTLQFELTNAVEQYNHYKDGAGSYAYGQTIDQRTLFSMAIHNYPNATDAKSCREIDAANVRKHPLFASHKIDQSESGESAYLRTRGINQAEGRAVFGEHLHRFVFRDGLCAKVHVSTMHDEPAASAALTHAVESMVLKESTTEITRSFHVPPRGALALTMPTHWGFQTSSPFSPPTRTLTIRSPDGQFQLMITAFPAPDNPKETAETITRKTAESAREQAASNAVQTQLDIKTLKGRNAAGHFIFASDKSLVGKPAMPDNWKHMRQGMLKVGAAFATFTVFSNDENAADALRAMRALEDIEFRAQ